MLVPKFTLQNYSVIIGSDYAGSDGQWWDFADIIRLLCVDGFRERFRDLDVRKLGTDLTVGNGETVFIGGVSKKLKESVIAIKLLMPSLWCCDYFFWNIGDGIHTGIDIILPKGTPIPAFQGGKVTRIKVWDGVTKNEGNCVVVQDNRGYFRGYEHLDRIDVRLGDQIAQGTRVGTCGSTGNSTQYHLHLQVDRPECSPNPHWSSDMATIQKKTIEPLGALRSAFSSILDLPYEIGYQDAIGGLINKGFIKVIQSKVGSEQSLLRYEMALLLHRIMTKQGLYTSLPILNPTSPTYPDLTGLDSESVTAITTLWKYGLMRGFPSGKFLPYESLLYEQALALLGRAFFGLQDLNGGARYQTYLHYFTQQGYLQGVGGKIGKPLLRKDLFLILLKIVG